MYSHRSAVIGKETSVSRLREISLPSWSESLTQKVIDGLVPQKESLPLSDRFSKESTHELIACVEVYIETFRGLPVRLRVQHHLQQISRSLPERFQKAVEVALQHTGADYKTEASWELYGFRVGTLREVADLVTEEISREIDADELQRRLQKALRRAAAMTITPAPLATKHFARLAADESFSAKPASWNPPSDRADLQAALPAFAFSPKIRWN